MLTIRVTAHNKYDLLKRMVHEIEKYRDRGYLTGLMRVKNDEVWETHYGWQMYSYWGEVVARDNSSLVEEIKKKLDSSEDLKELVSIIWDVFIENYSDVALFREDVLDTLQGPDIIRNLLCVLNYWSDRLDE